MKAETGKYCYGAIRQMDECEFTGKCSRCDFTLTRRLLLGRKNLLWPTIHMKTIKLPEPSCIMVETKYSDDTITPSEMTARILEFEDLDAEIDRNITAP